MEDKKNLNMEEIAGMNLEDLDKVAGGFAYNVLNDADKAQYRHLGKVLAQVQNMPDSPYKERMMRETINTLNQFTREMEQKYGV